MFPVRPAMQTKYISDEVESVDLTDFSGGINITDSPSGLPANQFEEMFNFFYDRQKALYTRPQYKPLTFSTSIQDKPVSVTISSNAYTPTDVANYQVFRETLSNGWSYSDEVHVVSGEFTYSTTAILVVAVYNITSETWVPIWNSTTATKVSVCPYKINEAFDLIIFPDNANPERWVPSATTGTLSDLGLTPPTVADSFTATGVVSDSAEGMVRIAAGTVYYKFSFFYDDSNTSTKYGESATTVVTDGNCDTGITLTADATKKGKITITFTTVTVASNITKVRIYRAPDATPEGPYKYIGETDVTSTTAITAYVDTTPWGEEGIEELSTGSNPSLATDELEVVNARTVGAYIVGFDANMDYKLIYCVAGQPDVWNPLNYDYLDSSGQIALEFNRKIYIFTKKSCYQKDNVEATAYKICNLGTVDGRSVQEVGNGIIWMDYDTVYFADFVQQYGAKGDFPLDIGHPISESTERYDSDELIYSEFFERRYYLTYLDTYDQIRKCFVFDVDIGSWTQHSMQHIAFARGDDTFYSLGVGNSKYYVYEHDYFATVAIAVGYSEYAGVDYHDYESVTTTTFDDIATITTKIKKGQVELGGDYRKTFISSVSLSAEGAYASVEITAASENEEFTTSKTFSDITLSRGSAQSYPAVFDTVLYAPSSTTANSTYYGYAGFSSGYLNKHKKINRVMKSNQITVTLLSRDTRALKINRVSVYYKLLPKVT